MYMIQAQQGSKQDILAWCNENRTWTLVCVTHMKRLGEKDPPDFLTQEHASPGCPLDLENLEKWQYTWKTWKYGILKILINIMEKWHETWKNLLATKNSPLTPLKQYKIH